MTNTLSAPTYMYGLGIAYAQDMSSAGPTDGLAGLEDGHPYAATIEGNIAYHETTVIPCKVPEGFRVFTELKKTTWTDTETGEEVRSLGEDLLKDRVKHTSLPGRVPKVVSPLQDHNTLDVA
jgi:hypothetical protein